MMRPQVIAFCVVAAPALAGHELQDRDIAQGAALYERHCAECHGAQLQGQPDWQTPGDDGVYPAPPHDETGHTWHHGNVDLFDYTKLGGQEVVARMGLKNFNSGMPGFGDTLSDEQIWDILAYIRSTWPKRMQEVQAGRNPPHD